MSRFYFDIADGADFRDEEGSDWPDLAAARIEAVRYSAEILREMPEHLSNAGTWTMTVSDHNRQPLFTLKFMVEMAAAEVEA